jgi:MFS family permease
VTSDTRAGRFQREDDALPLPPAGALAAVMAPSAVGNPSVSSPLARHAALALLFAISLCQYVDRWSVAAVLNELQAPPATDGSLDGGFGLSDTAAGLVSSVFVVAYMVLSPVFGYFGDRRPRIPLIFFGSVLYAASGTPQRIVVRSFSIRAGYLTVANFANHIPLSTRYHSLLRLVRKVLLPIFVLSESRRSR